MGRRLYQDVKAYSNFLRRSATFEEIEDISRDAQIQRLSVEILTEVVDEETYVIVEDPHWKSPQAHYVASLPDGFRKRFLMHFWGLTPDDLVPKRYKHIITLNRWLEFPDRGIPKQSIEETLGYWT